MNLILVEIDPVQTKPEMSFEKDVVRVGREAAECDVFFDGKKYPMVSRRHADFRCDSGRWMIDDLGSSYGVFVDGQRIKAPTAISVGSKIQFGTDGPTVVVIWLEASEVAKAHAQKVSEPKPHAHAPAAGGAHSADRPDPWEMGSAPSSQSPQTIVKASPANLLFVDEPGRQPINIDPLGTLLGRDPGCQVLIDINAGSVSRKHATIRHEDGRYVLEDNKSFNGTLVNEQRITSSTPLFHNDEIRLGVGGPLLRFECPGGPVRSPSFSADQPSIAPGFAGAKDAAPGPQTIVFEREKAQKIASANLSAQPQLLMTASFGSRSQLTVGRGETNDISLDGLQISKRHARFVLSGATVAVEDVGSTNGIFVNGERVTKRQIGPEDAVQIGAFLLASDGRGNVNVFDTRARTRIDVIDVGRMVKDRSGGGQIALLDSISLSIRPNDFVGLLGPSGAGKSLLMEAMNGMTPPPFGRVMINRLDLYRHLDSLKHSIGYVPQEDIIHHELSVYRTLYYTARLRLSRDASTAEIRQIVEEVMDVTGLAERRDVQVARLSGGQRKRVSIAVELITKPSVIFLDEPTSGLDPAAEERVMKLFRQMADSGRTVVLTTHAMENVGLFDKIILLMRGKLVFYGTPSDALAHFNAGSFRELYARLEGSGKGPGENGLNAVGAASIEQNAESLKQKFRTTSQYAENVEKPLSEVSQSSEPGRSKKRRLGLIGSLLQWFTLSRRYLEVLLKDKLTLFILIAQAPAIALMTFLVVGREEPRDFVYFVIALVAIWFGTSVSAREIIREAAVFRRERMINLGLAPYLASKMLVLGIIVVVQCFLLFIPLKLLDLAGLFGMPGELAGIPQLWAMLLTAAVGTAIGLFVSATVRTSEMATSLVPLILIPQILFSGIAGVPQGIADKALSLTMPAAWAFDTMKRFSTLDTLEPEGANPKGKTKGMGLYKYIETENDKTVAKAKQDFEQYRRSNESRFQDEPSAPSVTTDPATITVMKLPDDLSAYVRFRHPWMNDVLNQAVLMLMFGIVTAATLIVLRLKD
ncbi:MAG TPA: FHA domain-containing protein [Pyrinomonadaceae bacterium]|nr:FHA domain-containing protein [Pyrinomonadaceae bacterium]